VSRFEEDNLSPKGNEAYFCQEFASC